MDERSKNSWILILLLAGTCFGTLGDTIMDNDGNLVRFPNNNFIMDLYFHPSASESYETVFPAAKGTAGQAVIIDSVIGDVITWIYGTPSTSAAHNILSPTHSDTETASIVRGDILYGFANGDLRRLAIGAANEFLKSDGTDVDWGFIDISDSTNLAVDTDHLKLTDDTLSFSDNEKVVSHARQDSFLEQIDFVITATGGPPTTTVTGSLEKEGTGDLTQMWSAPDDFDVLDCTPAKTVDLTGSVGTDTSPAAAFVYILNSAKTTLVVNTSWPADSVEHIRIASIVLQSAATTGTDSALMNRNWNDNAFAITNPKGGDIRTNERIRKEHALWDSGVVLSITGSGTGTVTLDTTAGVVYQLNAQSFPAIDMAGAGDIHLVNLSSSEFSTSVNLVADITTLADGVTSIGNNKFFNLVIWGAQNRTGESSHLMCNLPIGQYGKQSDATIDAEKFSVHTIPNDFRGIGFLIAELTFKLTGGGSTWTLIQNKDLLGQLPILIPGGGTTNNITTFVDSAFEVFGNLDDTKRIGFQADSVGAGETRIITVPDADVTLVSMQSGAQGALELLTQAELEILDGATVTTTELNYLDGTTLGTATASNVLAVDSNLNLDIGFGDRTNVGKYDGSVDLTAITGTHSPVLNYSFEITAAIPLASTGSTTTALAITGNTRHCDRGTTTGLKFDGSSFGDVTGYKGIGGSSARTFNCFFKIDGTAGANRTFFSYGDRGGANAAFFDVRILSSDIVRIVYTGNNTDSDAITAELDNEWHMLSVVVPSGATSSDVLIYIDAVDRSDAFSGTDTLATDTATNDVRIGAIVEGGTFQFVGCMDEVALIPSALTQPQLQLIFDKQKDTKIEGTSLPDPRDMADDINTLGSGIFGDGLELTFDTDDLIFVDAEDGAMVDDSIVTGRIKVTVGGATHYISLHGL